MKEKETLRKAKVPSAEFDSQTKLRLSKIPRLVAPTRGSYPFERWVRVVPDDPGETVIPACFVMMNRKLLVLFPMLVLGIAGWCADTAQTAPGKPAAPENTGAFSGKVVETMNAAGYTYVLVDTGKQKNWAAAPQFAVKKGDEVSIGESMPMEKYHSKTLNRDFDVVYFAAAVRVNGKSAAPSAPPANPNLPKDHPPIGGGATSAPVPAKVDLSGIKKAEGGKTVAEVWAGRAKLSGKEVKVRGRVVKYNPMIMNRNWVHVRDGSGAEGSNDLLVTTATDVKVGDMVVVTGKVATDRDFGANYKYAVMIEDGKIQVE
jgi:hypothetical protein